MRYKYRKTDKNIDKHRDISIHKEAVKRDKILRQICRQKYRLIDRQVKILTGKQTDRNLDRYKQVKIQTDRWIGRKSDRYKER